MRRVANISQLSPGLTENVGVPSFLHEALLEIFREHPEVIAEILRRIGTPTIPEHDALVVDRADLGAVIPRELTADCLVRFERNEKTILVVVLEVQLAIDSEKLFTWPAYLAGARLRHRCNTVLVVMTPTQNVADWARRMIAFGPGAGHLQPHVIGPQEMPAITDPAEAARAPELAVISAIAHGRDKDPAKASAIAAAAASAMFAHSGDRAQLYYDYVWANLSEAARKALEMLPQNYEYQFEGFRRAKAEGAVEGEARGKAEGEARGLVTGLMAVFTARGLTISPAQRSRILACSDPALLNQWLVAAQTATDVTAVLGKAT